MYALSPRQYIQTPASVPEEKHSNPQVRLRAREREEIYICTAVYLVLIQIDQNQKARMNLQFHPISWCWSI